METPENKFDFSRLWDEKTTAQYLDLSIEFLQVDRAKAKRGQSARIPFIRLGRAIKYDPADVRAFAERCKVRSAA
jgi:hypothetical protein